MALDPYVLRGEKAAHAVGTGFTYRPASEIKDFPLRPEVVSELADRMSELEVFRRRPVDSGN
jgi:hypothetical protein